VTTLERRRKQPIRPKLLAAAAVVAVAAAVLLLALAIRRARERARALSQALPKSDLGVTHL
jgi:hypothetical protein